ncbi:MAG: hypothetical protein MUO76_00820 [Anaerolineaceae bacterium]|nr:hypothetical protein [Anaerolineaceae bacterium]
MRTDPKSCPSCSLASRRTSAPKGRPPPRARLISLEIYWSNSPWSLALYCTSLAGSITRRIIWLPYWFCKEITSSGRAWLGSFTACSIHICCPLNPAEPSVTEEGRSFFTFSSTFSTVF